MAWFCSIGLLMIIMAIISTTLKRLPLTSSIIYLGLGVLFGPFFIGLIRLDLQKDAVLIERLTEVAVIISLFSAGLKLRLPLKSREWLAPVLLATVSMLITIILIAIVGVGLFGFSLGAAVLLGAILAPTDPVLAASIQVLGPQDRDRLRFSLTGEAGLNDGTAFPFVMLGLGLLGYRNIGEYGWRWLLRDVIWAIGGGLLVGTVLATGVSRLVLYLRKKNKETESLDDFLALGLICLSYGIALRLQTYGFLAVFAAGLALRRGERMETQDRDLVADTDEQHQYESTSANMVYAVLTFNEHLERFAEVVIVLLLGAILSKQYFYQKYLWIIPILFLIVRPISVIFGVPKRDRTHPHLLAWFGIRGIGSVYYLAFVVSQGISESLANELGSVTLLVVTASILVHGLSAAPLMLRHSTDLKIPQPRD
jgi:NhaP-type Na+/H+ or K+/H+ antiporter